jgi:hypothetical protein
MNKQTATVPRYYIKTDELKYYWTIKNKSPLLTRFTRNDIVCEKPVVYLDILQDDDLLPDGAIAWKKIKLYLDDGATVIGYVPCTFNTYIHISNMDSLFDGRFNS